jgi:hypothetical protein
MQSIVSFTVMECDEFQTLCSGSSKRQSANYDRHKKAAVECRLFAEPGKCQASRSPRETPKGATQ